jgi:uncharacterized membrane protein YqiK
MFKQVNHDIQTNINFQPIFGCRISVTNKKKKDEFTHISRKVVRLLPHLVLQESESHKRVNLRLSSINQQIESLTTENGTPMYIRQSVKNCVASHTDNDVCFKRKNEHSM